MPEYTGQSLGAGEVWKCILDEEPAAYRTKRYDEKTSQNVTEMMCETHGPIALRDKYVAKIEPLPAYTMHLRLKANEDRTKKEEYAALNRQSLW